MENKFVGTIVAVAKNDAYSRDSKNLVGHAGVFEPYHSYGNGWYSAQVKFLSAPRYKGNLPIKDIFFLKVRVKKVNLS